jgi:hypothetical protein
METAVSKLYSRCVCFILLSWCWESNPGPWQVLGKHPTLSYVIKVAVYILKLGDRISLLAQANDSWSCSALWALDYRHEPPCSAKVSLFGSAGDGTHHWPTSQSTAILNRNVSDWESTSVVENPGFDPSATYINRKHKNSYLYKIRKT